MSKAYVSCHTLCMQILNVFKNLSYIATSIKTKKTALHVLCGSPYKVVSLASETAKEPMVYRSADAAYKVVECMVKEKVEIE